MDGTRERSHGEGVRDSEGPTVQGRHETKYESPYILRNGPRMPGGPRRTGHHRVFSGPPAPSVVEYRTRGERRKVHGRPVSVTDPRNHGRPVFTGPPVSSGFPSGKISFSPDNSKCSTLVHPREVTEGRRRRDSGRDPFGRVESGRCGQDVAVLGRPFVSP